MSARLSIRGLATFLLLAAAAFPALAAEPVRALDLISADCALCLEIPNLKESWNKLSQSPVIERLVEFPALQRVLEDRSFQSWRQVDTYIRATANQSLAERFRDLFAKSMVFALYATPDGSLQGILVGEADDDQAIQIAYDTWNQLEPRQVTINKSHHGIRYHERKRRPDQASSLYFARSKRWFALTDREVLIQDVVERFVALTSHGKKPIPEGSILESPNFLINRGRLTNDHAAYLHINARAWDQILTGPVPQSGDANSSPQNTFGFWKHIDSIGMSLRIDDGLIVDSSIQLNPSNLPSSWTKVVTTAATAPEQYTLVPSDALIAMSSRLEIKSFLPLIVSQLQSGDQPGFAKIRRVAKSMFGGQDLFDDVLPAIARHSSGYAVVRTNDNSKQLLLDGMLRAKIERGPNSNLLFDISQGLETTLTLLGAYFSSTSDETTLVKHEHTGSSQLHWLTQSAPYPIGFGIQDRTLIVSGSEATLRRSFDPKAPETPGGRLAEHSRRYFASANQLFWFDTSEARRLSKQHGASFEKLFDVLSTSDTKGFAIVEPWLKVVDSLFVAGRIESDHVRITFGGGLDAK